MKGTLRLSVSKNLMQVTAWIEADGENEITGTYIYDKLNELGVKTGIIPDNVTTLVRLGMYDTEMVVAKGKEPLPGTDGSYTFYFDVVKKEYQPAILEDGSVDYSIQYQLVKEGDLLAKYHPAKPGTFGYTVFADIVSPVPVKELSPLKLRGVKKKDNSYYAKTAGEVSYQEETLTVNNVLTIKENATNATGDIRYLGDIHVCGDVLSGTFISAEGNIIVDGAVENAVVKATKDIIIRKGIFGKKKAVITAKGSIHTTMIEEADVIAGESITLYYSYCSNLTARKDIVANTKEGKLIGGTISAGNSIIAKYAGNSAEIRTVLRIIKYENGINPQCKIAIERECFRGTEIFFGKRILRNVQMTGEYHLVEGEIHHYALNNFSFHQVKPDAIKNKKPIVLLVDDQSIALKTFYSYLRADYHVLAVNSAKDAFSLMEQLLPDLILLDYRMPDMDGGKMLEKMRNEPEKPYHDVPVIFVTAVADKDTVTKCLLLYPQGYLIKPLTKVELLDVVNNFFARRSST